jgi:threonine dehydrogenase-like Zn-dependent dehydrogenase
MCSTGRYTERGIERLHGFMTQYFVEQPEFLVKIPERLRSVAVLLEPMSIVNKAIEQALQIQRRMVWEPRRSLVLGAGSIGLLATMALRKLGVETRTVDRVPADHSKATAARATGATYSQAEGGNLPSIPELPGYRPDLILEASGSSALAFGGVRMLGINGVLLLIGASGGNRSTLVPTDVTILELVLGNRTVVGCVNSNRSHFERALDDLSGFEREWPGLLASMITRRLPLTGFAAALDSEEPAGIKTLLEVSSR